MTAAEWEAAWDVLPILQLSLSLLNSPAAEWWYLCFDCITDGISGLKAAAPKQSTLLHVFILVSHIDDTCILLPWLSLGTHNKSRQKPEEVHTAMSRPPHLDHPFDNL